MKKYPVGELTDLVAFVSAFANFLSNTPTPRWITADQHRMFVGKVERLAELCSQADIPVTASYAADALKALYAGDNQTAPNGSWVYHGQVFANLNAATTSIANNAGRELSAKIFLSISPAQAALYAADSPLFGPEVAAKFPSLIYDIDEAAKCLGLGRSTAAAFHLMRTLEGGIRALSRCLQIPDPTKGADRNWGSMLKKVKASCDAKWPAVADRFAGDGHFFEEVYGNLAGMQNPYRNATMHLEKTYTEDESAALLAIVKALVSKVASRMDEEGQPLA